MTANNFSSKEGFNKQETNKQKKNLFVITTYNKMSVFPGIGTR